MGIVTNASLRAIDKGFQRLFQEGQDAGRQMARWPRIARRVPSSARSEVYGWTEDAPLMRDWTSGDRSIKSIKEKSYELTNKRFESTIGVDRVDIVDDLLGLYRSIMQDLGQEGVAHIDRGCFAALKAGRTTQVGDGKMFFATDHLRNANVDGTGTNTPTSNILNPTVTTNPEWYLLYTMGMHRPIVYQDREALRLDSFLDFADSHVFLKDQFLWGAYARRRFGFSRWQFAISSRDDLTKANYQAAYKMMLELKRDGGDPWGLVPSLLVVPPSLRAKARDILVAERNSNGSSNTEFGTVDLLVEPLLA